LLDDLSVALHHDLIARPGWRLNAGFAADAADIVCRQSEFVTDSRSRGAGPDTLDDCEVAFAKRGPVLRGYVAPTRKPGAHSLSLANLVDPLAADAISAGSGSHRDASPDVLENFSVALRDSRIRRSWLAWCLGASSAADAVNLPRLQS
jgi:hypothetical protein